MLKLTIDDLSPLLLVHTATIPESYMDENDHMNVMWYTHLFDRGAVEVLGQLGIGERYMRDDQGSAMILESHVRYLAEVRLDEEVEVFARILARSEKRIHLMLFMVNKTTSIIAATFEATAIHVDMKIRRSSPLPAAIASKIDQMIAATYASWDPPLCGPIKS